MPQLLDSLLSCGLRRRPLVGAHRGASARAPENTLAAFRAAIEDGSGLIELDVRLTRDGRLAVMHDANTRRTTGVSRAVGKSDYKSLRDLDAGRLKGVQWAGEPVPELGDVFALVRDRLSVNVEVKGGVAAVREVARRAAEYGMAEKIIVSSFEPDVVRAASALYPPLLTGLLLDQPVVDPVAAARKLGASLVHVKHSLLTSQLADYAHRAGLAVLAWTVNVPEDMRRMQSIGVDAILSDDPRLLRDTLDRADGSTKQGDEGLQ